MKEEEVSFKERGILKMHDKIREGKNDEEPNKNLDELRRLALRLLEKVVNTLPCAFFRTHSRRVYTMKEDFKEVLGEGLRGRVSLHGP